ncbi:MAG: hypothetical protein ACUVTZ_04710 [Armatimonadota bacterium]
MTTIDASGLHYKELNERVRQAVAQGETEVRLVNVRGHRYIGDGVSAKVKVEVHGVPGNDLGAFMNGPTIVVHGNAQDACGNTMNDGKIVVKGHAGDVLGYGMRGGKLHILGDVGYRVGIHMKAYKKQAPVVVIGGTAKDFLGEYMAGGTLVLLGLERNGTGIAGDYFATGMHGGVIFLRGEIESHKLGKEVTRSELTEADTAQLRSLVEDFCADFGLSLEEVLSAPFTKYVPLSARPYGSLYAY